MYRNEDLKEAAPKMGHLETKEREREAAMQFIRWVYNRFWSPGQLKAAPHINYYYYANIKSGLNREIKLPICVVFPKHQQYANWNYISFK